MPNSNRNFPHRTHLSQPTLPSSHYTALPLSIKQPLHLPSTNPTGNHCSFLPFGPSPPASLSLSDPTTRTTPPPPTLNSIPYLNHLYYHRQACAASNWPHQGAQATLPMLLHHHQARHQPPFPLHYHPLTPTTIFQLHLT